jgi:trk system potassium uptake protein TrkA
VRKIAVIGLGRFGIALARQLAAAGTQVIAIDRSGQLIADIKDDVDVAVRLDATDEGALASQEIDQVDVCVVAIGENFEASLLTTVIVKKLGVPFIVCRAQTQFHAEIFRQIGADEVIQPEAQTGEHLARKLANPHLEDFIQLADGYTLIEIEAPKAFQHKTLHAIGLRAKYHVNLIAIKRTTVVEGEDGEEESRVEARVPKASDTIRSDDVLVLVGSDEDLAQLPKE